MIKLHSLFIFKYEANLKHIKSNYYALGNKARVLLNMLRCNTVNQMLMSYPVIQGKFLTNPQDIANAFSDYYSSLYNLQQKPSTPQLTSPAILLSLLLLL